MAKDEASHNKVESKEIQKIIDMIYSSKPEEVLNEEKIDLKYDKIIHEIEDITHETIKEKKWFFKRK